MSEKHKDSTKEWHKQTQILRKITDSIASGNKKSPQIPSKEISPPPESPSPE